MMRNVWATLLSVWLLFAVIAVLAWTRQQPAPSQSPVIVVKGKNGIDARSRFDVCNACDDAHVARSRRMIAATTSTAVPVAWLVARARGSPPWLFSASLWLGLAMSVRLLGPVDRRGSWAGTRP